MNISRFSPYYPSMKPTKPKDQKHPYNKKNTEFPQFSDTPSDSVGLVGHVITGCDRHAEAPTGIAAGVPPRKQEFHRRHWYLDMTDITDNPNQVIDLRGCQSQKKKVSKQNQSIF